MSKQQPSSGWENPDGHPSVQQVGRPMFDADGKPVTSLPEPEPLTPAERAMFAAMERGQEAPELEIVRPAPVAVPANWDARLLASMGKIKLLALAALESPSPAAWAVALDEISKECE